MQFEDGEHWVCTACGRDHEIGWDDEMEDTVGMPGFYTPHGNVMVCDECVGNMNSDDLIERWGSPTV